MSSMSSMSVPRRSARLAAKAALQATKTAPVVAPVNMADVQKINEMMIRCNTVIGQLPKIKANTDMFVLLKTVRLWESNELFRHSVQLKITEYLEKEIPTCLEDAFQTNNRELEWAMYELQDAVENLKEMMNGSPVSMVRVKLQKLQTKLEAEVDELADDLDYCVSIMRTSCRAKYVAKLQELTLVKQRLKNLSQ